jgi:PQQ-dependent catabolism-associated CXXCW motif protein
VLRALLLGAVLGVGAASAQGVPEPAGFREAPYRGPVPDGLAGAVTVATADAHRLWEEGRTAFVDVLPREERPADLPEGTIWRVPPHDSIPGATWLPNTGYAALSGPEDAYLRDGLAAVTGGDPARPVLFFCLQECWMSWNAAKRALAMGYTDVLWYPGGADGWAAAGHPTERLEPWAGPGAAP